MGIWKTKFILEVPRGYDSQDNFGSVQAQEIAL